MTTQNNSSSSSGNNKNGCAGANNWEENVLSFDTAMAHFMAMFPALNAQLIESVLRQHDGNVAQTIEELLARSAENESALSCSSSSAPCSPPPAYSSLCSSVQQCPPPPPPPPTEKNGKSVTFAQKGENSNNNQHQHQQSPPKRDPCADDEKIALLIQNREFLRYLRHDPHFQRAVIGQHQASARYAHHYLLPSGPMLLASSRVHRSPNIGRLFNQRGSNNSYREEQTKTAVAKDGRREQPLHVPDGPMMPSYSAEQELAIPQGPLIDYVDAEGRESGWAGRIKAKLAKRPPEGSDALPPSPVVHFTDEQMRTGIHGMLERGGKGLLEKLVKKFSITKSHNANWNGGSNGRVRIHDDEEEEEEEEREMQKQEQGTETTPTTTMARMRGTTTTRGIQ